MNERATGQEREEIRNDLKRGIVLFVDTPQGFKVVLQQQKGHLRAGIVNLEEGEDFKQKLSEAGGATVILEGVLEDLGLQGITQEGTGEMKAFGRVEREDFFEHFNFKGKKGKFARK